MRTRIAVVALAAALFASVVASAQNGNSAGAIATRLTPDARHIIPPAAEDGVIVNVPQRMLFYGAGADAIAFPVAVGRPTWQTPLGAFTIVEKRTDPVWHVPPSILRESEQLGRQQAPVVAPGPDNPLGRFWLGTSLIGIGIHGTNVPSSITRAVTHGCIRAPADGIRMLFDSVALGTPGATVYEPVLVADIDGEIYLEVHADVYRRLSSPPMRIVRDIAASADLASKVDWARAAGVVAAHTGIATIVTAQPAP